MVKIIFIVLIVGLVFGFGGAMFTDGGDFHPDFFVIATLLSSLLMVIFELRKERKKIKKHKSKVSKTNKAS